MGGTGLVTADATTQRRRVVERHRVSVAVPRLWPDLERWAGPGS